MTKQFAQRWWFAQLWQETRARSVGIAELHPSQVYRALEVSAIVVSCEVTREGKREGKREGREER